MLHNQLHEPKRAPRYQVPTHLLKNYRHGNLPASDGMADEVDFFGWYYGVTPENTKLGWPSEHRNWMAERLGMNRDALDRALFRARKRQENEDNAPFYRLPPAP